MRISIITSLYNSQEYLENFYKKYLSLLKERNLEYEFIFVDDGSNDKSVEVATEICKNDSNVRLVILSKNFGQHNAIYAGLEKCKYEYIYVCDVDLEDKVENLEIMIDEFDADNQIDVVYSSFSERKGGFVRGWLGGLFYSIFSYLTDNNIDKNQSYQRLMRKRYVEALLKFSEYESYMAGLMFITGFNQKKILTERNYKGISSYNFKKRFDHALNALISFSSKPLVFISILGFIVTFISFLFIVYILFQKLYIVNYEAGWSSLILSIWFVGGVLMISIGVLGLYISKIFNQVKNRPKYIIRKVINE